MPVSRARSLSLFVATLVVGARPFSLWADEIRLKDGKKLNGVIVGYEDNMFKVKTDFGYLMIEKDKIATIIPSTPATKSPQESATKKDAGKRTEPGTDAQPQVDPAVVSAPDIAPTNASGKIADPPPTGKSDKNSSKITTTSGKPEIPVATSSTVPATSMKGAGTTPSSTPSMAAPAAPKEPELPPNREEITGNFYTNYTHGFRMYKAPSWNLIEEARSALPNAIVAMGTSNESTLMVVGEEKAKDTLDASAATVEKRLHDVYVNYQRVAQRKTTVGGLPAIEYKYRGKADEHDWSGKLVIVGRGSSILTVLAMTHADTDLMQIQENVISRSIASLDFSVH